MNTTAITLAGAVALAAAAVGGYWFGRQQPAASHDTGAPAAATAASGVVASAAGSASAPRRVLFYRNPMGLPDTSPVPKKDSMGMDYIAVYEGEDGATAEASPAGVSMRISTEKIQKLGVRTEPAELRRLGRVVRASGRVEPDERRIFVVTPKFEGYVERLHVNATGQPVARGQELFEVYSPELVAAQREYAIAMQGVAAMSAAGGEALSGMKQLAESSLTRLANWDLSRDQIDALVKSGQVRRTVSLRSPVAGTVTEKRAFQGMRFMPGEMLYQVTDLSAVWVIAEVFEQDLALVRSGARAKLSFAAFPDAAYEGRITYVYPTLKADTRTVPVRIELANPGQRLKPAMFAQVELDAGGARPVLAVPDSAVIDSGTRRVVLVQQGEGRYAPREVKTGARSEQWIEIREGLKAGDQVVVSANFLLDAESNLKAAIAGFGAAGSGAAPAAANEHSARDHAAHLAATQASAPAKSAADPHAAHKH